MTSDSACVAMLQLCPALSSAVDITANPRESAASSITSGASPAWRSMPQLAPWWIRTLRFQPFCRAQGSNGFDGS